MCCIMRILRTTHIFLRQAISFIFDHSLSNWTREADLPKYLKAGIIFTASCMRVSFRYVCEIQSMVILLVHCHWQLDWSKHSPMHSFIRFYCITELPCICEISYIWQATSLPSSRTHRRIHLIITLISNKINVSVITSNETSFKF